MIAADYNAEDSDCFDEIDAFIFHTPTWYGKEDPVIKKKHQLWAIFTTETEENYPKLAGM
jgi:hypothetical protein